MTTCRWCGMPIMLFSFKEGKQWYHSDPVTSNLARVTCSPTCPIEAEPEPKKKK